MKISKPLNNSFSIIEKNFDANKKNETLNLKDSDNLSQTQNLNSQPNAYIGKSIIKSSKESVEKFINKFLNEKNPVKSTKLLLSRYPELAWLTGDVNATPEVQRNTNCSSISETLFGKKHIEFDRTIVGIECLKQVINNDYEAFTECQKENIKLTKENFKQLRDFTMNILKTSQDIDTLLAYTVINDLGKIKSFTEEIENITGQKTKDHDEALILGLKTIPNKIPSFDRLQENRKIEILNALNADFNLGQFVQAECLPGNLTGIKNITPEAMDLYLAHMFFDVAGAAGHVVTNGSLVMNNNVYKGYMQGIQTIKENSSKSEKEIYDKFLETKANDLDLPYQTDKDKAIVRLAIISRTYTKEEANQIKEIFNKLNEKEQNSLISGLTSDGIKDKGILLYYSPAFIQNAVTSVPEHKTEMLEKAFKIMSNIYANSNIEEQEDSIKIISLANLASAIKEFPNKNIEDLLKLL